LFYVGRKSDNPSDPDYIPTIFHHTSYDKSNKEQKKARHQRLLLRRKIIESMTATITDTVSDEENVEDVPDEEFSAEFLHAQNEELRRENETLKKKLSETKFMLRMTKQDSSKRLTEMRTLRKSLSLARRSIFRYENLQGHAKMFKFYTGISKNIFNWLIKYGPNISAYKLLKISDQLLLVLIKLRLGLTNRDISYRFQISQSTVTRILRAWLPELAKFMTNFLIYWPEKEALHKNLPSCFKKLYSKCVCIIDCTEVFIERPFNLNTRAKTWSNYKNTNTIKYLVACAPSGAISYLSNGWGGRVSDKEITLKSGFLNHIENGDQVLADRGFTVAEEIACKGGVLVIPFFTKGKNQLSSREVDTSRSIANVRIHIERVIGRMRKFNVINTTIPILQVDLLDDIITCIGGLVNLSSKIV